MASIVLTTIQRLGLHQRNKREDQVCEEEEESESQCLLPPPRKGGMSRSTDKIKRTVQWTDNKGDNLAEVLVYEPSEVSDSDACICTIM
ncbi:uncharacterized protein LOC106443965 isoform X2 [Brassica napus]|nr:uncharacterized protein LOC106443965 isoform X2 [Brassica napus]